MARSWDALERTDHFYEASPAYPAPPLPPLARTGDKDSFRCLGIKPGSRRYYLTRLALLLSGYTRFERTLDRQLVSVLRTTNLRLPGLFSPTRSATLALEDDPHVTDPVERAVALTMAIREFWQDLKKGECEPDRHGDHIAEMGLYPNLFSTNLTVLHGKAQLFKSADFGKVNVVSGGRFYILDLGPEDARLSPGGLAAALRAIRDDSCSRPRPVDDYSIGFVSAASDSTQIKAFKRVETDLGGSRTLETLRNIFFTLCLDLDSHPSSKRESAFWAHNTNHGNRWYHSSIQVVVFGNAEAALIMAFSAGLDGNVMVRGAQEIFSRSLSRVPETSEAWDVSYAFSELTARCPPEVLGLVLSDIRLVSDNQQATFEIHGVGKASLTAEGVTPVGSFVIALERTMMDVVGRPTLVHQFLSMSRYHCMGLLTENVTTGEVVECAAALDQPELGRQEKVALIQRAVEAQQRKARERRSHCPLDYLFRIYLRRNAGLKRRWIDLVVRITALLQRRRWGGLFNMGYREVLISHPAIVPGVPVLGRPGVRLPYVRYLAIHYQIHDDRITITHMPSAGFRASNADFTRALAGNLRRIVSILYGHLGPAAEGSEEMSESDAQKTSI